MFEPSNGKADTLDSSSHCHCYQCDECSHFVGETMKVRNEWFVNVVVLVMVADVELQAVGGRMITLESKKSLM